MSIKRWVLAALVVVVQSSAIYAAAFTPGNIVVVRIGDGNDWTGNGDLLPVNLLEFTPQGVLQQTILLPTTASGNQHILSLNRDRSNGQLNLSADGRYLLLGGTDAAPRVPWVGPITRTVARIDAQGAIDTSTTLSGVFESASEVGIRGVASIDGSNFWVAGKGVATSDQGLQYIPFGGSSGTSIISPAVQSRHLSIVNGQLYNTDNGIQAVGVGLPTTGPVTLTTVLPALPGGTVNSGLLFDLNPLVPGLDAAYVAYGNNDAAPDVLKYTFDGTTWAESEGFVITLPAELPDAISSNFLTGKQVGNDVQLFVTTKADTSGAPKNSLVSILDTPDGYTTTFLATTGPGTTFRGVSFVPVDEPTFDPRTIGDFVQDGTVDGADFLRWQQGFGSTTDFAADANGSSTVDASDLAVWQANFGSPASIAAVPEPSASLLAASAATIALASGARRRRTSIAGR